MTQPLSDTDTNALKPCPWCEGEGWLHRVPGGAIWPCWLHTETCPAHHNAPHYLTEAEAIAAGNTRPEQNTDINAVTAEMLQAGMEALRSDDVAREKVNVCEAIYLAMSAASHPTKAPSLYKWLGNRSVVESAGVGLSCHHCKVSWGGCAAECCCPQCGAPKGYHEDDRDVCYCESCKAPSPVAGDVVEQAGWAIAKLRTGEAPRNFDMALARAALEATPSVDAGELVEQAERAVRITVWNFLRGRGVKQDACYPIIEGAATSFRAALNKGASHEG